MIYTRADYSFAFMKTMFSEDEFNYYLDEGIKQILSKKPDEFNMSTLSLTINGKVAEDFLNFYRKNKSIFKTQLYLVHSALILGLSKMEARKYSVQEIPKSETWKIDRPRVQAALFHSIVEISNSVSKVICQSRNIDLMVYAISLAIKEYPDELLKVRPYITLDLKMGRDKFNSISKELKKLYCVGRLNPFGIVRAKFSELSMKIVTDKFLKIGQVQEQKPVEKVVHKDPEPKKEYIYTEPTPPVNNNPKPVQFNEPIVIGSDDFDPTVEECFTNYLMMHPDMADMILYPQEIDTLKELFVNIISGKVSIKQMKALLGR